MNNPPSLKELLRSDLARFTQTYQLRGQKFSRTRIFWESLLFKAGYQAVLLYRLSHWCYRKNWIYPAWFLARLNILLTGAEIEFNAVIGPGFYISHPVGIVIGRGTVIGEGATFFQGVSIGVKSWHPEEIHKFPQIGNHCYFFAKSSVVGGVSLGDYCVVAAHALLSHSMPQGSLALGIPAEVIDGKGQEMISSFSAAIV